MITNDEPEQDQLEVFTPRDYQLELVNAALDHNTIVSLGTGFGKTYIAIMLVKNYSKLMEQKNMKALFVVDKVSLAEQQKSQLERHLDLPVGHMDGSRNSNLWTDKTQFDDFFTKNVVFVATHAIINGLLNSAFIKWTDIALLIIDECHHVLGLNHEYRLLMNSYRETKDQRPRVLGLTASVVNSKVRFEKLEDMIRNLETLMCSQLEMANSTTNLAKYGAKPVEVIVEYKNSLPHKFCSNILIETEQHVQNFNFTHSLNKDDELFTSIKDSVRKAHSALEMLGSWSCYKICNLYLNKFKSMRSSTNEVKKLVIDYAISVFQQCIAQLEHLSQVQADRMEEYATDQVHRIVDILYTYRTRLDKNGEALFAIIFVQERHIAFLLSEFLKHLSELYSFCNFIKTDYVVGRQGISINTIDSAVFTKRSQSQVIERFRNGELNVLIATNVLEEGIDVRSCNCVIRTSPPEDFRSYIQSRGRARSPNSIYWLLCPERESYELNERLQQFNAIEKLLISRYTVLENDINESEVLPDAFPPYVVESTGARVTLYTAVSLIHHYCSKLPSDIYTRLMPEFRYIHVQESSEQILYKVELLLPRNSPVVRPIRLESPVFSRSLARKAVALEACKVLHQYKELTDYLKPISRDDIFQDLFEKDNQVNDSFDVAMQENIKRHIYERKLPSILANARAQVDRPCNCYIIDIRQVDSSGNEEYLKNWPVINLNNEDKALGFVCTTELPLITQFPVYLRQGKSEVTFVKAATPFEIDSKTMKLIYDFHSHIFEDILKFTDILFSPAEAKNSLLVVPIIKKRDSNNVVFDAELDSMYLLPKERLVKSRLTQEQQQKSRFDVEHFKDVIVYPWYKEMEYFYVREILHDKRPGSEFSDNSFTSFNAFYEKQYGLQIFDQGQPLLDAKRISKHMNLIFPWPEDSKKISGKSPKLVPELVFVHPLSVTHWTMIFALPTIFYRLNQFLLVDELRCEIVRNAFKTDPQALKNWPKLDYVTLKANDLSKRKSSETLSDLFLDDGLNKKVQKSSQPIENKVLEMLQNRVADIKLASQEREEVIDKEFIEMPVENVPYTSTKIENSIRSNTVSAIEFPKQNAHLDWLVNGKFEISIPLTDTRLNFKTNASSNESFGVYPALLLQALTTKSAHNGYDLERLETIGDSFLKYAITTFLYFEYTNQHEGNLSSARVQVVCNANLFKIALRKNLPSLMQVSDFKPKEMWLPPAYVQSVNTQKVSVDHNPIAQQHISDKSIADTVEALIGAHLISLGANSTLKFMKWLGLKVLLEPKNPDSPLLQFMDTEEDPTASKRQLFALYTDQRFEELEKRIGYKFGNKAFLIQAFTHASYLNERVTGCYQRLEFLGDAVLDYLITRYLFEHNDQFSPGELTDLRSALVNNTIFGSMTVRYGLHKFFMSSSSLLEEKMYQFVEIYERNLKSSTGTFCLNFDSALLMLNEDEVDSDEDFEVPKALGDLFESLAGAIFLDSGMNLEVVWCVYYNLMKEPIEEYCRNPPLSPIRVLYEMKDHQVVFSNAEQVDNARFRVVITIDEKLEFEGFGSNGRSAKLSAAKCALIQLRKM